MVDGSKPGSFWVHVGLQDPDLALIGASFYSTSCLKIIRLGGEAAGKKEAETLGMLGSEVGASHDVEVFVLVRLYEVEATGGVEQVVEEQLGIDSEAHCNISHVWLLWPERALNVKRRGPIEDHWLLCRHLDGKLNDGVWIFWQKFMVALSQGVSAHGEDALGIHIGWLSTFDGRVAELLCAIPGFSWNCREKDDVLWAGDAELLADFSVKQEIALISY